MKIPFRSSTLGDIILSCPECQSTDNWKNGTYTRKWFHTHTDSQPVTHRVQRYICRNPHCPRQTFSVLPAEVMPYCRFLWSDILKVSQAIREGKSYYTIARYLFNTATANCIRLGKLLSCLTSWIQTLCQQKDVMRPIRNIDVGIKQLRKHLSCLRLKQMWYRFNYPKTFMKGVINIV